MNDDDLYYWVALQFIHGLGPATVPKLLATGKSPLQLFALSESELTDTDFPLPQVGKKIAAFDAWDAVEYQLSRAVEYETTLIPLTDSRYPQWLKDTPHPPFILHVRGTLVPQDEAAVALVGTRRPSAYGRDVTQMFAHTFATRGVTVVSGLARGVDTLAHTSALDAGGRTLAVLGCGTDVVYPAENVTLFDKIIQQGALISEYPMGAPPDARHFPRRNRIISGLSRGTVVTEAPVKSGALITTRYAREQGRKIFGVPGPILSKRSSGAHKLIAEGAYLAETPEYVLKMVQISVGQNRGEVQPGDVPVPSVTLPASEKIVYDSLSYVPIHIDELAQRLQQPSSQVLAELLPLELNGLVTQHAGKMFSLTGGGAVSPVLA